MVCCYVYRIYKKKVPPFSTRYERGCHASEGVDESRVRKNCLSDLLLFFKRNEEKKEGGGSIITFGAVTQCSSHPTTKPKNFSQHVYGRYKRNLPSFLFLNPPSKYIRTGKWKKKFLFFIPLPPRAEKHFSFSSNFDLSTNLSNEKQCFNDFISSSGSRHFLKLRNGIFGIY